MPCAAIAVLSALAAAASGAPPPRGHVDPEAIREVHREAPARFASARAISHYLEARRLARSGDPAGAAEHLRLSIAHDEQSPELHGALAEILALGGRLDEAEAEARRAAELARTGPTASEAHVLLGRIAAARGRIDDAALSFRHAVRIEAERARAGEPAGAEPWRLLATLYAHAGDENAACRVLEDLAAHVPAEAAAGFAELAGALLEARQPARAERHLRRALELDGRDVAVLRLLARAHEALRRDLDARDDLLAILRIEPDDASTLLALGRMSVRAGDVAAAREWFGRHVRASPDAADAHVRVAFQWLEGGQGAEALAAARAGMEEAGADPRLRFAEGLALQELRRWAESAEPLAAIRPEAGELYVSARVALADGLSRAGRHREAECALAEPLATHPDELRLLLMRATVLERAGRARDAVALLRRAIAERERAGDEPDLPDLYAALGTGLVRAGRPAEAVRVLTAAVAERPRNESLLYALGAAHDRAGEPGAAIAQMRALLAVNPDHAEALNFIGYTYAEQGVQLEEAERLVRRALELKPRAGHILDSLGWILLRRGDHRAAVALLEQADALSGPDATILEHLGDAYRAAARPEDAARAYRRALAAVPQELPRSGPGAAPTSSASSERSRIARAATGREGARRRPAAARASLDPAQARR